MSPIRFSHLRAYGRSAAHGHHARLGGEDEETAAMERGTAVHALVFGTRKVCGYPGAQRRGREYEAFAAEHADHEILTMAEFDKSRRMADSVLACELAQSCLQGVAEETLLFRWMGLDCRATPDIRGPDYVTELKSSSSAEPARFGWHALRMGYHAQLRFQAIGTGARIRDHWIVAVESDAPYPVTVFRVTDRAIEVGEKLLVLWAERLKNCEASNVFPPYTSTFAEIDVPDEEAVEFEEAA